MSLRLTEGDLVLFDSREASLGQFFQFGDYYGVLHADIDFLLKILLQVEKSRSGALQAGVAPIGKQFPWPLPDGLESIGPMPVKQVLASMRNFLVAPERGPDVQPVNDRFAPAVLAEIDIAGMGKGGEQVDR